jgi:hypothetical protein
MQKIEGLASRGELQPREKRGCDRDCQSHDCEPFHEAFSFWLLAALVGT